MSYGNREILRSYRNLYRHGLQAVRYSSPARYTLRDYLQYAFRTGKTMDFNSRKIENTIQFLKSAGKDNGLEHRILKNLLHVRWWHAQTRLHRKHQKMPKKSKSDANTHIRNNVFYHYNVTLKIFNESMDLCLPEPDMKGIEVYDSQLLDVP